MGRIANKPKLVFVVGAPRSGTKLLRHLLNRHSAVSMTSNETEFLPYLMRFEEAGGLARADGFARLVQYLRLEDYFWHRTNEGHAPTDFNRLQAICAGASASEFFRQFLVAEVNGSIHQTYVGDKSPSYVRFLPEVFEAFPEAKVIHIVRDPRSQCGSLRATFGKVINASAQAWAQAETHVIAAKSQNATRILTLRYEDLTDAPEHWIAQICNFLNLPFDPEMLRVDVELENARAGAKPIALRKADKNVFERYLTADEISMVEGICEEGMAHHNYEVRGPAVRLKHQTAMLATSDRIVGLVRLAGLTIRRHGWRAFARKIRLVYARRAIMAGRW